MMMVPPGRARALGPILLWRNTSRQVRWLVASWCATASANAWVMRACSASGSLLGRIRASSTAASVLSPRLCSMPGGVAATTARASSGRPHSCSATAIMASTATLPATQRQLCCIFTTSDSCWPWLLAQLSQASASSHCTWPPLARWASLWPWRVRSGHCTSWAGTCRSTPSPRMCKLRWRPSPTNRRLTAWARAVRPSK